VLPTAPATVLLSCSTARLEHGDRNAALVDRLAGALVAIPQAAPTDPAPVDPTARPAAITATALPTDSRPTQADGGVPKLDAQLTRPVR
jgi:hypothetical protein